MVTILLSGLLPIMVASPADADQELGEMVVCDNTIDLEAELPGVGWGQWSIYPPEAALTTHSTVVIENPGQFNSHVTGLPYGSAPGEGMYTSFLWTVTNTLRGKTCTSTDSVVVKAFGFIDLANNAGNDMHLCADTFTLQGVAPADSLSGSWTVILGQGVFADNTLNNTHVTNIPRGRNVYRWTVYWDRTAPDEDCISTDDVDIFNDLPSTPDGGVDQIVCADVANLNARQPVIGTGAWTVVGGTGSIANTTAFNTTVTGMSLMKNTFKWATKNAACELIDTVIVWNYSIVSNAGTDIETCADTAVMDANIPAGTNGIWTLLGGSGTIANNTFNQTIVRTLSPGLNSFNYYTRRRDR